MTAQSHTHESKLDETVALTDMRVDPALVPAGQAEGSSETLGEEAVVDVTSDIGVSVELHPEEVPAVDPDAAPVAMPEDARMAEPLRDDFVAEEAAGAVTDGVTSVELHAGEATTTNLPDESIATDEIAGHAPPVTSGETVGVILAPDAPDDATSLINRLGRAARDAAAQLALAPSEQKNRALREAARALRTKQDVILEANARDLDEAADLSPALRDRLLLNAARIEAMARGLVTVAGLPDPIGTVLAEWTRPNGLHIQRVRVPLGVIGIIYESRPNVTADAGALCIKAGNAAILRGGSDSFHSSRVIAACLVEGLVAAGLPAASIQLVPTTDRAAVGAMLSSPQWIDVIVPRGGKSLIERVQRESRVPVFAHLEGINHVYVDAAADLDKARAIAMNAKLRRVSVCGAMETLLVDHAVADTHLLPILQDLLDAGCEVRGDATVVAADARVRAASEQDWSTEYLDAILSVRVVDGIDEAIRHVNHYGSHHTDAIVTEDESAAAEFLARVDSGIVLVNASTQFADGGEFGMGAEIGISTGKLHARGPVGAEQLTSYKYLVRGNGQVRP